MARHLAVFVVLVAMMIVAAPALPAHAAGSRVLVHPASAQMAAGHASNAPIPPPANYDEQIGETFAQDLPSLAYNVTALAQTDAYGYGPAYLLNGLTNAGYWYQIGVSYDWPFVSGGYVQGFAVNFEVFDSHGNSVFPTSGGGGLDNFTGTANSGDNILLSLSFSGGQVRMSVRDWNTGATGLETYPAQGSAFVGLSTASDANGFFTGLMTEWYHVDQYLGGEGAVTYSNPKVALTSATLWADEFNANTNAMVFGTSQKFTFTNPNQLLTFTSNGAVAQADAHRFITGSTNSASVTLSYSVAGGGSGYSGPTLSYVYNVTTHIVALTTTPTTYFMDKGSQWSVPSSLSGGTTTERWTTSGTTGGTASADILLSIVYYHQVLVTFAFDTGADPGGPITPPPTAPIVQYLQLGVASTTQSGTPSPVWADSGSTYTFESPIMSSSSTERWATATPSGTVVGPSTIRAVYFHQFPLTLAFYLIGSSGQSPVLPSVSGYQFGSPVTIHSIPQNLGGLSLWLDSGTKWNASNPLAGAGADERWLSESVTEGSSSAASSASISYYHQFALAFSYSVAGGGSPAPPTLTGVQFGKTYAVSLTSGPTIYFLDSGSHWSLPASLPEGTLQERWVTALNQSAIVSGSSNLTAVYQHQFHVAASYGPQSGGTISLSSGWYDSGSSLQLAATASAGWKLGGWSGNGTGSYSGALDSTSVQVVGPIAESATFYPGLTISARANGAVSWSYGAQQGIVPAGQTQVVYAPTGSNMHLEAVPSSFLYSFSGWTHGANGTAAQESMTLSTPTSVTASFSLNLLSVGGIGAAAAVIIVTVWMGLRGRRGPPAQNKEPQPAARLN